MRMKTSISIRKELEKKSKRNRRIDRIRDEYENENKQSIRKEFEKKSKD